MRNSNRASKVWSLTDLKLSTGDSLRALDGLMEVRSFRNVDPPLAVIMSYEYYTGMVKDMEALQIQVHDLIKASNFKA